MKNKMMSPVIIFVLVLLFIAIGIFVYSIISTNSNNENKTDDPGKINVIKPTLNLSLENYDENQEKVIIFAKASMEDGTPITTIVLPNDAIVEGSETEYEVTENGEYTFKAISENGEQTTVSINVTNIEQASASKPYIPIGFKKVEDTDVETGFVIEDSYGNEYVWVPVENGQLTRETILDSKYQESTSTASALVNSVAQNYGFYIAKYEASEYEIEGEKVAATMPGKTPWTNITFLEATEYANGAAEKFGYEDVNTAMLNSYAWDTVLKWFDGKEQNYSSSVSYGNYSGSIYPTGATEKDIVYNICDIAGNVREWTTEIYKNTTNNDKKEGNIIYRVIRGGGASLSRTPKSHHGYPEDTMEAYWGFRLILYK